MTRGWGTSGRLRRSAVFLRALLSFWDKMSARRPEMLAPIGGVPPIQEPGAGWSDSALAGAESATDGVTRSSTNPTIVASSEATRMPIVA
ncbi:MAG: hypothetical protein ACI8TP_002294 [Acidimicrobiales bacterium]|jgi:hypothetical protein